MRCVTFLSIGNSLPHLCAALLLAVQVFWASLEGLSTASPSSSTSSEQNYKDSPNPLWAEYGRSVSLQNGLEYTLFLQDYVYSIDLHAAAVSSVHEDQETETVSLRLLSSFSPTVVSAHWVGMIPLNCTIDISSEASALHTISFFDHDGYCSTYWIIQRFRVVGRVTAVLSFASHIWFLLARLVANPECHGTCFHGLGLAALACTNTILSLLALLDLVTGILFASGSLAFMQVNWSEGQSFLGWPQLCLSFILSMLASHAFVFRVRLSDDAAHAETADEMSEVELYHDDQNQDHHHQDNPVHLHRMELMNVLEPHRVHADAVQV